MDRFKAAKIAVVFVASLWLGVALWAMILTAGAD
jgi:hypothetical protein